MNKKKVPSWNLLKKYAWETDPWRNNNLHKRYTKKNEHMIQELKEKGFLYEGNNSYVSKSKGDNQHLIRNLVGKGWLPNGTKARVSKGKGLVKNDNNSLNR